MPETVKLYDKIVNNGPFSAVAPHAQLRIGAANEKAKNYADAVKATNWRRTATMTSPISPPMPCIAPVSWQKQADTAEYDQSAAAKAIAAYTDFVTFIRTTSAWRRPSRPWSNSRPSRFAQF